MRKYEEFTSSNNEHRTVLDVIPRSLNLCAVYSRYLPGLHRIIHLIEIIVLLSFLHSWFSMKHSSIQT
jgi:hypothetical protein